MEDNLDKKIDRIIKEISVLLKKENVTTLDLSMRVQEDYKLYYSGKIFGKEKIGDKNLFALTFKNKDYNYGIRKSS